MYIGNDTFTVVRAALVVDSIDTSVDYDWANAAQTVVTGASVQAFLLSTAIPKEENRDRSWVLSLSRIYAPPTADVLYTDRILFKGLTYDIYGDPNHWRDLTGAPHHIAFLIRRREG